MANQPEKPANARQMFDLQNRNYIVTGGAQGIGFAMTKAICEMGGNVAVLDIQASPAQDFSLLENLGTKVVYIQTDVTAQASLESAINTAIRELGSLDGCVTCAGIAVDKPFLDQTWDEFNRIQDVNLRGTFFTAQLVAKQIAKQKTPGSMVLIASTSAHKALPGIRVAAYNASKGGVLMLSKALAVELAPLDIRVNSISPGFTKTEMTRAVLAAKSEAEGAQLWLAAPNRRLGTAEDLVGAAIYLLSDAAKHTTAEDIAVTGGLIAGTIDGLITYQDSTGPPPEMQELLAGGTLGRIHKL